MWQNKQISIVFFFFFLFFSFALAKEKEIVKKELLKSLAKRMPYKIITLLENGKVVLLVERGRGLTAKLLYYDVFTEEKKVFKLPVYRPKYIALNESGTKGMIYKDRAFWHLAVRSKKAIVQRLEGTAGFALYENGRSLARYFGDEFYAWGYTYDKAGQITNKVLKKINVQTGDFAEILEQKYLVKVATKHFPKASGFGYFRLNKSLLVFAAFDNENRGKLIAINLLSKKHFVVAEFAHLYETVFRNDGRLLAYIIQKAKGKQQLWVYVFSKRKNYMLLQENGLYAPTFAAKKAVVGHRIEKSKIQEIIICSSTKKKKYLLLNPRTYVFWQFVQSKKALLLFDGHSIYKLDL